MPSSPSSTIPSPMQNNTTTEPSEENDGAPAHMIDHKFYPMIMDAILDYAPHSVLVAFRRTSREYLERADARIFKHIVLGARPIRRATDGSYEWVASDYGVAPRYGRGSRYGCKLNITTPWGENLPAIRPVNYDRWVLGLTPDDEKELEKRYLELYRHIRILDIDDADDESLQWFTNYVVRPQITAKEYRNRVRVVRLFATLPNAADTLGDTAIIFPTRWPVEHVEPRWRSEDTRAVPAYTSRAVHIIRTRPDYRSLLEYSYYYQDPDHTLREETFIFTHARPGDADMTRFRGPNGRENNKARWDGFVGSLARRLVRRHRSNFDPISCTMVDFDVLQPDWFGLGTAHTDMRQRLMYDIADVLRVGVDLGKYAEFDFDQCTSQRRDPVQRARAHEIAEGYLGFPPAQGPRADDPCANEFYTIMEKSWKEMHANPPPTPPPEPDEWLPLKGVQTLSEDLITTALEHFAFLSAEEYAETRTETDLILEAVPDGYFDPLRPGDEMGRVRSWRPWKPGRCA